MRFSMSHNRVIGAPADETYRVVADVASWPAVFGPTVHVEHFHRTERDERFQLWALVAGEVSSWVSRRDLDPAARRIVFRQERSHPPITEMAGVWSFEPLRNGGTRVRLDHSFSVDDEHAMATIQAAVDRNSTEELAALARIAELGHPVDSLVYTFSDSVVVDGPPADVYEFVRRSDLWPERLPHVARVVLSEEAAGVQRMEMDTVTADGAAHTTRSIRVCSAPTLIAYKQLLPPRMLLGHSGRWTFTGFEGGARVVATHTIAIDPEAARAVLGANCTLPQARAHLRAALGGNARATLTRANECIGGDRH